MLSRWCNVIHLTCPDTQGQKIPVLFVFQETGALTKQRIDYDINSGRIYIDITEPPTLGKWYHFEFHQRYVGGGNYRFYVKKNGEEVKSIINTSAQQFYNVKVYASNPYEQDVCPAHMKNLKFTNFL